MTDAERGQLSRRGLLFAGGVLVGGSAAAAVVSSGDEGDTSGGDDSDPDDAEGPQNPWKSDPITVTAIDHDSVFNDDLASETEDALRFWNARMERLRWEGKFEYREDAENPDAIVHGRDVDNFEGCEEHGDVWGCAPILKKVGAADPPSRIEVKSTNSDWWVEFVIAHEIGHTLGLEHSDSEEWPVMGVRNWESHKTRFMD